MGIVTKMEFMMGEFQESNTEEKSLVCVKGIRSEGHIRFLLAKLKVLRNEMQSVQSDYKKRTYEMKIDEEKLKKVAEEVCYTHHDLASTRERLRKQDKIACTLLRKLELRDSENSMLNKEISFLKQELKHTIADITGTEVKLNKALTKAEIVKGSSINAKQEIKEKRSSSTKKQREISKELYILDQQKNQLVIHFRKQSFLIDNLLKQKGILNCALSADLPANELLNLFDCVLNAK